MYFIPAIHFVTLFSEMQAFFISPYFLGMPVLRNGVSASGAWPSRTARRELSRANSFMRADTWRDKVAELQSTSAILSVAKDKPKVLPARHQRCSEAACEWAPRET